MTEKRIIHAQAVDSRVDRYLNPNDRQIWHDGYNAGKNDCYRDAITTIVLILHERKLKNEQIVITICKSFDIVYSDAKRIVESLLS